MVGTVLALLPGDDHHEHNGEAVGKLKNNRPTLAAEMLMVLARHP